MRQSGNRWFIGDKLGNTRALVDDDGAITDYYAYDAWGGLVGGKSSVSSYNPFRWNGSSGYQYISNPGMYHAGARTYDPTVGRWLQRDPIAMSGGHPNLYVYCANDPVNGCDPHGLRELMGEGGYLPVNYGDLADHVEGEAQPGDDVSLPEDGDQASYLSMSKQNHTIRNDEWGKQGASIAVGTAETLYQMNPATPFVERDPVGIGMSLIPGSAIAKGLGKAASKLKKLPVKRMAHALDYFDNSGGMRVSGMDTGQQTKHIPGHKGQRPGHTPFPVGTSPQDIEQLYVEGMQGQTIPPFPGRRDITVGGKRYRVQWNKDGYWHMWPR